MKAIVWSSLLLCVSLGTALESGAQVPMGVLAVDERHRHPVTCVSWNDAQAYVSWLSRATGRTYRLPTEAEWERAADGSQPGCDMGRTGSLGTCPVGSYGSNDAGLSDMVGNLLEWTADCWKGDCGRRVLRGGSWRNRARDAHPGARTSGHVRDRGFDGGFRVLRSP